MKALYSSSSFSFLPTKSYHWNVYLLIFNNFSEQNLLHKPVFDKLSRLFFTVSSSPFFTDNNTVSNKIKHFKQLSALGVLQIDYKSRTTFFLDQPLSPN